MKKTAAKKLEAEEQAKLAEEAAAAKHTAEAVTVLDAPPAPEILPTGGEVESEGKPLVAGESAAPDAVPAGSSPTASAAVADSRSVKVRVIGQAVGEEHGRYEKGDTFYTTPARAEALGSLVSIVADEE